MEIVLPTWLAGLAEKEVWGIGQEGQEVTQHGG